MFGTEVARTESGEGLKQYTCVEKIRAYLDLVSARRRGWLDEDATDVRVGGHTFQVILADQGYRHGRNFLSSLIHVCTRRFRVNVHCIIRLGSTARFDARCGEEFTGNEVGGEGACF